MWDPAFLGTGVLGGLSSIGDKYHRNGGGIHPHLIWYKRLEWLGTGSLAFSSLPVRKSHGCGHNNVLFSASSLFQLVHTTIDFLFTTIVYMFTVYVRARSLLEKMVNIQLNLNIFLCFNSISYLCLHHTCFTCSYHIFIIVKLYMILMSCFNIYMSVCMNAESCLAYSK